ncbi:hypothetical protein evm_006247 [Chilo suppressalis]|nr:hypothetical protein evm_006247 [Chilo suppressalis]
MNSRHLGKVWRVANDIEDGSDEDTSMPIICSNLDSWIASYHEDSHMRLSLRTSSVLVDGAAKLYKRKLNQLYQDVTQLDYDLIFRKRMRRNSSGWMDGFHDAISSTFTESTQEVSESAHDKQTDEDTITTHDASDKRSGSCENPSNRQEPKNRSRVNKSIQVSPEREPSFNEELPFGHIMVYDNYKDRIPSRIIFSSLNYNVSKLA